jgi:signal transduction histidine kinase/CheY-like chemotaxis protein
LNSRPFYSGCAAFPPAAAEASVTSNSSVRAEGAAKAQTERLREAQVAAHFKVATFSVGAALFGAITLTLVLHFVGALRTDAGLVWLSAMGVLGLFHISLSQFYFRAQQARRGWRIWAFGSSAITLVEGLGWGSAPLVLTLPGHRDALLLAMLTTIGVSAGSVIAYGRYLPTLIIAFVTPNVPYLIYSSVSPDPILRGSCFLLLLFMAAIGQLGLAAHRGSLREISMRMRNEQLAFDLQRQKDIAERANVAKSAFLAAASHDLRQPVHALGLYVGALRALPHAPEAEVLIERIESSIGAMDKLFSAILDLSRLDAGVVEVHRTTFAIDDFLKRICPDFAEEAHQKGLRFAVRKTDLSVYSDPVLLERIVRNLLSNAIRYTDRGGVLIRCRKRGDVLAIQVWDSGRGIHPNYREAIFQEYFQIGNPERDREKGLGLGLAIVKKLTDLLDSRLVFHSRPGRGSCFEVSAPIASSQEEEMSVEPQPLPEASQALIAVVDDEAPIRHAMSQLLQRWGYEPIAASSGDEILQKLLDKPALIVCDYRLRGAETGIQVIERLRAHFRDPDLPAVLITGDTAPDRLAEARASRLLLLHKPVPNAILRAAIGDLVTHDAERESV